MTDFRATLASLNLTGAVRNVRQTARGPKNGRWNVWTSGSDEPRFATSSEARILTAAVGQVFGGFFPPAV